MRKALSSLEEPQTDEGGTALPGRGLVWRGPGAQRQCSPPWVWSRGNTCLCAWKKELGAGQAAGEPSTFWSGSRSLSYYYFFFFELLRAIYRNHLGVV